jgi:hypothetical protein
MLYPQLLIYWGRKKLFKISGLTHCWYSLNASFIDNGSAFLNFLSKEGILVQKVLFGFGTLVQKAQR